MVHTQAQGLDWVGDAHAASMTRIATDHQMVNSNGDALENAANIAWNQASTLTNMARHVTHKADEILEQPGWAVGEDLVVENTKTTNTTVQEFMDRQLQAEEWTETLQARAENFTIHRGQVASDLIQAVGQCDDPDYVNGALRRIGSKIFGGILVGGAIGIPEGGIGVVPGMVTGAIGGALWGVIGEATGEGPTCK